MRWLLAALVVLMAVSIAGCGGPGALTTNVIVSTPTQPSQAPTLNVTATAQATPEASNAVSTTPTSTPRSANTRTPAPVTPAPTRTDGLPVPEDARESKNVPDTVRTFLQTQLKGQRRIGQAESYSSSHPIDEVMTQYETDLKAGGWESIPLTTTLPDNIKLLIAQKDIRAFIVFTSLSSNQTLTYIVTTAK